VVSVLSVLCVCVCVCVCVIECVVCGGCVFFCIGIMNISRGLLSRPVN
jgi:hypothetical protein